MAREGQYADMLALSLRDLARLAILTQDYDQAKSLLKENLEINKESGDKSGFAYTLRLLGTVARITKDYPEALRIYADCLTLTQGLDEKRQVFATLLELALLNGQLGNHVKAIRLFGAVETLYPIIYEGMSGMSPFFLADCETLKTTARVQLNETAYQAA